MGLSMMLPDIIKVRHRIRLMDPAPSMPLCAAPNPDRQKVRQPDITLHCVSEKLRQERKGTKGTKEKEKVKEKVVVEEKLDVEEEDIGNEEEGHGKRIKKSINHTKEIVRTR